MLSILCSIFKLTRLERCTLQDFRKNKKEVLSAFGTRAPFPSWREQSEMSGWKRGLRDADHLGNRPEIWTFQRGFSFTEMLCAILYPAGRDQLDAPSPTAPPQLR